MYRGDSSSVARKVGNERTWCWERCWGLKPCGLIAYGPRTSNLLAGLSGGPDAFRMQANALIKVHFKFKNLTLACHERWWNRKGCRPRFFPSCYGGPLEASTKVTVAGGKEICFRFGGNLVESQPSNFQKVIGSRPTDDRLRHRIVVTLSRGVAEQDNNVRLLISWICHYPKHLQFISLKFQFY